MWKLLGEVGLVLCWLLPGKGTESDRQGERDGVRWGGKGLAELCVKLQAEPMLGVTFFTSVQSDSSPPEETAL